jgi:fructan beta-fructosidase
MLVAMGAERRLNFYESTDLKSWNYISSYGPDGGFAGDNWECPDMFMLPLNGNSKYEKWVLMISAGTDKMQYFVGDFDGKKFTNEQTGQYLPLDFGKDFYAARTWRDYDSLQQQTIVMGWLGNWDYAQHVPSKETYNGQGIESIPRALSLITYPEGMRLKQTPIPGLKKLRNAGSRKINMQVSGVKDLADLLSYKNQKNVYELEVLFKIDSAVVGMNLLVDHTTGRSLVIQYDPKDSVLSVDRRKTSDADFCCHFPVITQTHIAAKDGMLRLHIYVDQSSVEIFVNEGKAVCSMLTFPTESQTGIEVFSKNGTAVIKEIQIWPLKSIW